MKSRRKKNPRTKVWRKTPFETLRKNFKDLLGDRVKEVRASKTLTGSPARLVSDESGTSRHMYRINRLLDKEYELPVKIAGTQSAPSVDAQPEPDVGHNAGQSAD